MGCIELILTPAEDGTVGAIEEAKRLQKEKGYFFVGQHFNPSNPETYNNSTSITIFDDLGNPTIELFILLKLRVPLLKTQQTNLIQE